MHNLKFFPNVKGFSIILVEEKRIFVSNPSFFHVYWMHNTGNVSISSTFNIMTLLQKRILGPIIYCYKPYLGFL